MRQLLSTASFSEFEMARLALEAARAGVAEVASAEPSSLHARNKPIRLLRVAIALLLGASILFCMAYFF